jgi:aminoglycoside 3-N-acetyltransferase
MIGRFYETLPRSPSDAVAANTPQVIYDAGGTLICAQDFTRVIRDAGVDEGDTVFVHSDLKVFGKLCTSDKAWILGSIVEAIKESVGHHGTVVMPTFTYSFTRGEVFDVSASKSMVGMLTEYFRTQQGVCRTCHPLFSVAVWGCRQSELLQIDKDSFGQNSIFGKIHKLAGKIVFLGASFESCTFIHYVEQMHGVPYRYLKAFRGTIRANSEECVDECTYFVRDLDSHVVTQLARLEEHLLQNNLMKRVPLGSGQILTIEADLLFSEGRKLLDRDIYFFLKDRPNNTL